MVKETDEKEVKKVDEVKEEKGKKFNPKWLEGLKFHYAEKKMIEKNGRKTLHASPMERPLKEEDLLSWKDYGNKVIIATNDGKKYPVKK